MIRNEICCDVCGETVAIIRPGFFSTKLVISKFLICKIHKYIGGEPREAHVCFACINKIQNAIQEKEQSK